MLNRIKQLFCSHDSITVNTEMYSKGLMIVKTSIQCQKCKKSFAQHPNENCCYVRHIHAEILKEQFIQQYKSMKQ